MTSAGRSLPCIKVSPARLYSRSYYVVLVFRGMVVVLRVVGGVWYVYLMGHFLQDRQGVPMCPPDKRTTYSEQAIILLFCGSR